jgi:hypothetical protein
VHCLQQLKSLARNQEREAIAFIRNNAAAAGHRARNYAAENRGAPSSPAEITSGRENLRFLVNEQERGIRSEQQRFQFRQEQF